MSSVRTHRALLASLILLGTSLGTSSATATAARPSWAWPVDQPDLVRGFQAPDQDWRPGHRGIDLAARPGDVVLAIGGGVVAFVGTIAGKPVVSIDHPDQGLRSTYEPVLADLAVGRRVEPGTAIGHIAANGGHCAGRCLHLGVRRIRESARAGPVVYLDPAMLLRGWAILKPTRRQRHADGPG